MSLDNPWHRVVLGLRLLAETPALGGIVLRARAGPVRDDALAEAARLLGAPVPLHPDMTDETLSGGLDLSATLARGQLVRRAGLLDRAGPMLLRRGERCSAGFAARLAQHVDAGGGPLIVLDEGVEPEEHTPDVLRDRLAFEVDLDGVALADLGPVPDRPGTPGDPVADPVAEAVTLAATLGIADVRAVRHCLAAARALSRSADIGTGALADAAILTLAHRATCPPIPPETTPPPETDDQPTDEARNRRTEVPQELLLEAVRAHVPDDLLTRLGQTADRGARGSGSGAKRKGNRRGRPLPARAGPGSGRVDVLATLRAAAPWQTIRRAESGRGGLQVRARDLRMKRYEEQSDRVLIFAVDASGSAALARLAEAKGAVELLLAQAYARRDHVALVSFRGQAAQLLLPPTRSLVQTKRRLAGLPGGGGTPLASGMDTALQEALQAQRKGLTPVICILTDGRANVARDGEVDRMRAAADTQDAARLIRRSGVEALVIDTGTRPAPALRHLAQTLDATYLPLPRADAERLSAAVTSALEG